MAVVRASERASGKAPGLGKDMAYALRRARLSSSLQHPDSRDRWGLPHHREEDTGHLFLEVLHRRRVHETVAVQYPVPTVALPMALLIAVLMVVLMVALMAVLMAVPDVILVLRISLLQLCNTEDPAHDPAECLLHPLVMLQLTAVITVDLVLCFKNVKNVPEIPESDPGKGPKSADQGLWLTTLDN